MACFRPGHGSADGKLPRLNRDAAIKVLPESFANDRDRLARFEREAQTLAALNHPRIATIYGLEESGSVLALAMELVEGPTLAERLESGPMPASDALPLARDMADALEYAHERGIGRLQVAVDDDTPLV